MPANKDSTQPSVGANRSQKCRNAFTERKKQGSSKRKQDKMVSIYITTRLLEYQGRL